jgi:hypothetical protein
VQGKRGILAQLLTRSHERNIFRERDAAVLVLQLRWIDPGSLSQSLAAGSLCHGKVHQCAGATRIDGELSHAVAAS